MNSDHFTVKMRLPPYFYILLLNQNYLKTVSYNSNNEEVMNQVLKDRDSNYCKKENTVQDLLFVTKL